METFSNFELRPFKAQLIGLHSRYPNHRAPAGPLALEISLRYALGPYRKCTMYPHPNLEKAEYTESELPKIRQGVNVIEQWVLPSQLEIIRLG